LDKGESLAGGLLGTLGEAAGAALFDRLQRLEEEKDLAWLGAPL